MSRTLALRVGAPLLAAALVCSVPAPAAAADRSRLASPVKADRAADWLADELERNRMPSQFEGYIDWGLTVDTLFALSAEGSKTRRVNKITRVLAKHVEDYAGGGTERYAGASAKLLVAAKVARKNVRDFGGHNLRARVLNRVAGRQAGFEHGRLRDRSEYGEFSNTISQSFGVLGLSRTGGAPRSTVDFLLKQRCHAGWFRLNEESDQRCRARQDDADVDATAYAIQALVSARAHGARLPNGAVRESSSWLVRAQKDNGAFGGGTSTKGANTNSTGLAVQALVATDRDRAAARAMRWVAKLQLTPRRTKGTPARDEDGAIAYSRAAFRDARRNGIPGDDGARDQFRRATAQGIFAFAPEPLSTLRVPRS
jgi:hypothetical protein